MVNEINAVILVHVSNKWIEPTVLSYLLVFIINYAMQNMSQKGLFARIF